VTHDPQIVVEQQPHFALAVGVVDDRAAPNEKILVEVDGVAEVQQDPELAIEEANVGDQRCGLISEVTLPAGIAQPGKSAVNPNAHSVGVADGMIFLADVRPIELTNLIGVIEANEKAPVADWQLAWHQRPPGIGTRSSRRAVTDQNLGRRVEDSSAFQPIRGPASPGPGVLQPLSPIGDILHHLRIIDN
jgi:hypothetical protein